MSRGKGLVGGRGGGLLLVSGSGDLCTGGVRGGLVPLGHRSTAPAAGRMQKQKKNLVVARWFLTCGLRVDWVWILEVPGDLVPGRTEGSWGGFYCLPRAVTWL